MALRTSTGFSTLPEVDGRSHGSLLTRWCRDDSDRGRDVVARRRAFFGVLWEAASALEPLSAADGSGA